MIKLLWFLCIGWWYLTIKWICSLSKQNVQPTKDKKSNPTITPIQSKQKNDVIKQSKVYKFDISQEGKDTLKVITSLSRFESLVRLALYGLLFTKNR